MGHQPNDRDNEQQAPQIDAAELDETDLDNVAGGGTGANLSVEGSDGSYGRSRIN